MFNDLVDTRRLKQVISTKRLGHSRDFSRTYFEEEIEYTDGTTDIVYTTNIRQGVGEISGSMSTVMPLMKAEDRGRDLTPAEMDAAGATMTVYRVLKV